MLDFVWLYTVSNFKCAIPVCAHKCQVRPNIHTEMRVRFSHVQSVAVSFVLELHSITVEGLLMKVFV